MKTALFKIRRTPLKPFAFFTFGQVLDFSVFKHSLHLDFPTAGTEKSLGGTRRAGVFAGLGHRYSP
jgi:hypothetical protein